MVSNETIAYGGRRGHSDGCRSARVRGRRLHVVRAATLQGNKVQLVSDFSDTSSTNDFGAISFTVPTGATLATLTTLSAEFDVTNDNCGGGSPRFQITIGGKNVFVYLGPAPNFNTCPTGWISSGNLVGTSDQCRVDTSQLIPGTQCSTWAAAVAALGAQPITAIQIVADGGWSQPDKEQTVLVRKVTINDKTYISPGPPAGKVNPAQLCKAERTRLGTVAFNELWGKNGNDRNAFGKCVSAMAHARMPLGPSSRSWVRSRRARQRD